MISKANWDSLPHDIISKILWSDHLQLHDKLRCQQVSKRWRGLLGQVPSTPEHGSLAEELALHFVFSDRSSETKHTALRIYDGPRILVASDHANPSASHHACCKWLTLKADLIPKIHLRLEALEIRLSNPAYPMLIRQLQEILAILQATCLRTPLAPAATIAVTGSSDVGMCV